MAIGTSALAVTADEALSFFAKYVNAANSYSEDIVSYYAPNAKIIRVVIKPDGSKVTLTTDMHEYAHQMRLGSSLAKINKYKNFYNNRKITKSGNDYKITADRKASTSDYSLPSYFIIGTDANGKLKIKEEMMYSKNQKLLIGSKKKK